MATAVSSAPSGTSHPLRNGYFRQLWAGRAISNLGDQFYLVALPWLILSLTNSGVALGTIMMTGAIPTAVLMLAGGVLSDRFAAPASQTLLPSIVESDQLPAANSVTQSTQQFTSIVGPAPAGLIVKSLGTAWALLIDAVTFLFVIG